MTARIAAVGSRDYPRPDLVETFIAALSANCVVIYGGGGRGNLGGVASQQLAAQGRPNSIEITLPPLTTVVFELGR